MSDEWSGIAQISVDGSPATQVDLYASPAIRLAKAYTVSGLTPGPHTVGIGPIGRKNANAQGYWVQVDAFDVTTTSNVTTTPSPAPTTISGVSGSGTSGSTGTLTATLTSGGSGLSGKTIRFTLNGSGAGTAATNSSGVATLSGVSLSGINAGNYSTAVAANFAGDTSYAASSGSGALTVIASTSGSGTSTSGSGTSTSGSTSGGSTSGGSTSTGTSTTMRIEETSAAITYSGTWSLVTNAGMYSGGTMKSSMDANAQATLSFTGTSVTFITMSDEWSGIAQIYVDGSPATQVDLYASPAIRQAKAYTVSGLTPGPHTVGIGPIGRKNANAQGYWVQVDAFDVTTASNVTTTPSPAPTTISGVSGSGTSGSTGTLTATLTSGGSGLSGKTIRFTLNGSGAGTAATNSSGVATLSGVS